MLESMQSQKGEVVVGAIAEFERREGFSVEPQVYEYFMLEALMDQETFEEKLAAGEFQLESTKQAILEALVAAKSNALQRGLRFVDLEAAVHGAKEIIETKMRCPAPFWIC